jgi:hypothetical protein
MQARLNGARRITLRAGACAITILVIGVYASIGHFAAAQRKESDVLKTDYVFAERFELRGADGKLGASLSLTAEGRPVLSFFDETGHPRLTIGLDAKASPGISFFGKNNDLKMSLFVEASDAMPHVALFDERGHVAIGLGVTKGLGPGIEVGQAGHGRASIGVSEEGSPSIELWDDKNSPRVSLSLVDQCPVIALMDSGRVVRAKWNVGSDGSASFSLFDRNKKERLVVQTDKDGKPAVRFVHAVNAAFKELNSDLQ